MDKLKMLDKRLRKIGITIEFSMNYPWIYLVKINGKHVTETFHSEHGFTIGFYPDGRVILLDVAEMFKLIRKFHKK